MASNITPPQPQQSNNQPNSVGDTSPTTSPLWNRAKIIRTAVISLLITLSLGAAVAGTTLSIVFATPIFVTLILASVLFAISAYASYKLLTPPPSIQFDWTKKLNDQFIPLPDKTVSAYFVAPYQYGSFYQNKWNPNIVLTMPRNNHAPYMTLFPVKHRDAPSRPLNHHGIIVNPIHPSIQNVQASSSPLSTTIHHFLEAYPSGNKEWSYGKYKPHSDGTLQQTFLPTEVRLTPITTRDFATQHKKDNHPTYILHARGPSLEEFHGNEQSVLHRYYQNAKETYKNILEEAVSVRSTILLLPLFSSVYDNTNTSGINQTTADDLCMSAMLDAINDLAQTDQNSEMLIILQPRNLLNSSN